MSEITAWRTHLVAVVGLLLVVAGTVFVARGEPTVGRIGSVRRLSIVAGLVLVGAASGATGPFELVLLAGVALLGILNHLWNLPLAERSLVNLRRVSWLELGLAGAVLASLALSGGPAAAPSGGDPTDALYVNGQDVGATVGADVTIAPGFPGANTFTVRLADLRHDRPLPGAAPGLRFEFLDDPGVAPSHLELVPTGKAGVYRAAGENVSADGRWRLTVSVKKPGTTAEIPLETVSRCRAPDAPGAARLRGSVEPGRAGANEIRATFLDGQGRAVILDGDPTVRVSATGHPPLALDEVRRGGPGEAVVSTGLAAGSWRVDVAGVSAGHQVRACFVAEIRPAPARR
ncbi:MAG TPA: hypothetical protein VGR20_05610 [Acidimicrobiia bacterium]|nr:hypothetical protein [Acidimicrobiia bacterium]